jgi:20S proteasome alpha/beta subunit
MSGGQIVAVSDRLITAMDDSVPGTDALKARKLSKTWAMMFSGNGTVFEPLVERIRNELGDYNGTHELDRVQLVVSETYKATFSEQFTAEYLSRYGLSSVAEFRETGLAQFGDKFYRICDAIDAFSLGIDLLVYGFGVNQIPHIFEISNPGSVTSHDLLGFAVIGSGFHIANASLRRKRMPYDLESVVYRSLEAKFSAETASGVGSDTSIFVMRPDGRDDSIGFGSVRQIKRVYDEVLRQPEPQEALEIISKLVGKKRDQD